MPIKWKAPEPEFVDYPEDPADYEPTPEDEWDSQFEDVAVGRIAIPADATRDALGLMTLAETRQWVIDHPIVWVVDGLFSTGEINMVAADGKSGKSTAIRTLAYSVASGKPFLGRKTLQGPVLYYTLEDKPHKLITLHDQKNEEGDDLPIEVVRRLPTQEPFSDPILHLRCACHHVQPVLIIVDMLRHMVGLENVIDYIAVGKEMQKFFSFVNDEYPNTTLVFCHHFNKSAGGQHGGRGGLCDPLRVMGSAAFIGCAHTTLLIDIDPKTKSRYVATTQRDGETLDVVELVMDSQTGYVELGKAHPKAKSGEERVKEVVVSLYALLKDRNQLNCTRDDLCTFMGVERSNYNRAISDAVERNYIEQEGTGKRSNPYVLSKGDAKPPPDWLPKPPNPNQGSALKRLRASKEKGGTP